ncbi:MAG: hypothetical protein E6772_12330 [Dysgonomonas sp.]|nr:hypothetical protein [Dysgonomonas sp.]
MRTKLNYLFLMLFSISIAFSSCSKDDDWDEPINPPIVTPEPEKPPVTTLTGAITFKGVDFSHKDLKVTTSTLNFIETDTRSTTYEKPALFTINFNDNVQIIFNTMADSRDKTNENRLIRAFKYITSATVNLIENNKIVKSDTFTFPITKDKNYFKDTFSKDGKIITLSLYLEGTQLLYSGTFDYTTPEKDLIETEEPEKPTPPEEFVYPKDAKELLTYIAKYRWTYTSSKSIYEGNDFLQLNGRPTQERTWLEFTYIVSANEIFPKGHFDYFTPTKAYPTGYGHSNYYEVVEDNYKFLQYWRVKGTDNYIYLYIEVLSETELTFRYLSISNYQTYKKQISEGQEIDWGKYDYMTFKRTDKK